MNQNDTHFNGDAKAQHAPLPVARYIEQNAHWPKEGQHILAHHDAQSVIVYQAYRHSIGRYAIEHGRFGGPDFSFNRMSWIKPNFLWMMYRCGWGTKPGQEIVLALRLRRAFFDDVLRRAVPSSFAASSYKTAEEWTAAVGDSEVRLQWDPDHAPSGAKVARRAIQLGLRGAALAQFASDALIEVIDMSAFVAAQRPFAHDDSAELMTPVEDVYPHDALLNEAPSNNKRQGMNMINKDKVKSISKFLSFVLRHEPQSIGLSLDEAGWASVAELLAKANARGKRLDRALLQHVIDTNDKQRFALSDDGTRIRANQGHSIEVTLGLPAMTPPDVLYHGTATRFLDSILATGLEKRNRHHVHLTESLATATAVGQRYGKLVLLAVDAQGMSADGHVFHRSDNGVWLTDAVPTRYLRTMP